MVSRRCVLSLLTLLLLTGCGEGDVSVISRVTDATTSGDSASADTSAVDTSVEADTASSDTRSSAPDTSTGEDTSGEGDGSQTCWDLCSSPGQAKCFNSTTLETCQTGASGCLEWVRTSCGAEQACEGSACVGTCEDACASAGLTQCAGAQVETCQTGASGCLAWVASSCPSGQSCQGNACQIDCAGACTVGQTRCASGRIERCTSDGQICPAWVFESNCPDGQVCSGNACVAPTDPSLRSDAEVCARWTADYPITTPPNFQSSSTCDMGTVNPGAYDDAIRRTSLYRYLVGLPDVVEDSSRLETQQACAVMQANNDGPSTGVDSHNPPSTWTCYTSAAAGGAGSSNLSWGVYHPATAVSQFIADDRVPSLGHRLWALAPQMGKTTFGYAEGQGRWVAATCMYSFDSSSSARVDYVAFPPAGPVPMQAMGSGTRHPVKDWSLQSRTYSTSTDMTITLTRASDGDVQTLTPWRIGGFTRPSGLAFTPRYPKAGETYTVEIGDVFSYEVRFISCD